MKTFDELVAQLSRTLTELRHLEESRFTTIEERHVKEQENGRRGVEAEEDLGTLELTALKRSVGLSQSQWRAYKGLLVPSTKFTTLSLHEGGLRSM